MNGEKSSTATAVFVVRIWRTHSLSGPRWRGRVEWLNTKQAENFSELAELSHFWQRTGLFYRGEPEEKR